MAAARGIASIVGRRRTARGLRRARACSTATSPTRWPRRWRTKPRPRARPRRAATRSATRRARPRSFAPCGPERRTPGMRITITGASGLIGSRLTKALEQRGDEVTPLSLRRDTDLVAKLEGRDAVVHLAGENVAQRWSDDAKQRIRESREQGTRRLVEAIGQAEPRPKALISASAVGYYGAHGDERLDEDAPPGGDFLAQVCVAWEREAQQAEQHELRVVRVRTGVLLDKNGGALEKMLLPFKLGAGGPVAGGDQYMPWIHIDDVVGIYARRARQRLERPGQRHRAGAGHEQGVRQGARARAAPPRGPPHSRLRDQGALRRHGDDRHRGPARRSATHAGPRLSVPAPRSRRGAAQRGRLGRLLRSCSSAPSSCSRTRPAIFHFDSGLAGTNSQISAPSADRKSPWREARPVAVALALGQVGGADRRDEPDVRARTGSTRHR